MQPFGFTAPALPLVFATLADSVARLPQIAQPAMSRKDIFKLDDEEDVGRKEASSRVQLRPKETRHFGT